MDKKTNMALILAVLAAIIIVAGCSSSKSVNPASGNADTAQSSTQNSASQDNSASNQNVKFSDTPYWDYAHLISGDTLDSAATEALAGFKLGRQKLNDGSIQITLTTISRNYRNQTYIVKPDQKLYFIETSMGDDTHDNDYSLGDDTAVLVDSQGYEMK